jgi:heavy metal sensor kinase
MSRFWPMLGLRGRLALSYVVAMILVLAVYAAAVFAFVTRSASTALDARLRTDFRWAAEMVEQGPNGTLVWFEGDDGSGEQDSPWLQVWIGGDRAVQSKFAESRPIPQSASLADRPDGRIRSVAVGSTRFRILSARTTIGGRQAVVQVAVSEAPMRSQRRDLLLILVLGLPIGIGVAGIGGYSLARRALAPVDRMAERARSISAERLGERLPIDNPNDELGRLASVFNETLGRLESSFDQMRQFTADISHELRTPLTAIRTVGEVGLRGDRTAAAYREVIGSMLEEVDRLSYLIDRLLALSRAETGQAKLRLEQVDLGELAAEVVAHLTVLAEEKRQTLSIDRQGHPTAMADRLVVRQALINLLDNAIKYTPAGGAVRVRVTESPTQALVEVSDTGPGIAVEKRTRMFERFDRAGRSASEYVDGIGLGLAIAKWAVEVNGGHLTLAEPAGTGSTFRVELPAA